MNKNIMLVEDDDVVRENYVELLSDAGFVVTSYPDRGKALESATEELPFKAFAVWATDGW